MPSGTYGNYSQRANMIIFSGISGTTQSENITSPPNNDKYSIRNMNSSTDKYLGYSNSQTARGTEWITVMMMVMVLVLMGVMM